VTRASAVVLSKKVETKRSDLNLIKVDDAYSSFLIVLQKFAPSSVQPPAGVHPTAVIASSAKLGENVAIGVHVVIGEKCTVGGNTKIYPNTVLGDGVVIGDDSLLYANVTVREQCVIGNRVSIHSGTVIGSDGFGFAPTSDGTYKKIPQLGNVVIEDDVEIGANCTIDRATMGETRICRGVKLDNLIHVAHNCVIGENTVIAAQTGVSGSTKIGKQCVIAGQVGFVGHIEIADRITIGAQSGVSKSLRESGKTYFGYPAKEHHEALRQEGAIRQLPELIAVVRQLQKRIEELEAEVKQHSENYTSLDN
jgi:UDP-3-O-[3-hydroxymyristoyl] glucosamine N-acyltransferase